MEPQVFHVLNKGFINRDGNTILFTNGFEKYKLPINSIISVAVYDKVSFTSQAIELFLKKGVPINFFSQNGFFKGSLISFNSMNEVGKIVLKQAQHVFEEKKRIIIVKEMIQGIKQNMLNLMDYYKYINELKKEIRETNINSNNVNELRGIEAKLWINFYSFLSKNLTSFEFTTRERNPPSNEVNAMISFGNALLYSLIIEEGFKTSINLSLSFIHQPWHSKRLSLAFDIADIFKPIIVYKLILKLVNKKMIKKNHFEWVNNGCYLNKEGKQVFIKEFNNIINSTKTNKEINRKSNYRTLIRFEFYKLINHFLNKKKYESYKGR